MTLVERTQELRTLVAGCRSARERMAESHALRTRIEEAESALAPLQPAAECVRLFRMVGIGGPIPKSANVDQARKRVSKVLERFQAEPRSSTLTKGKDWNKIVDGDGDLSSVAAAVMEHLEAAWRLHVEGLTNFESPDDIARRLAATEKNDETLRRYQAAFRDLRLLIRTLPKTEADIHKVTAALESLGKIHGEFDFDVPEAVKRFLDAVRKNGAELDLVTDELRQWLRENRSYDRFRVTVVRTVAAR